MPHVVERPSLFEGAGIAVLPAREPAAGVPGVVGSWAVLAIASGLAAGRTPPSPIGPDVRDRIDPLTEGASR